MLLLTYELLLLSVVLCRKFVYSMIRIVKKNLQGLYLLYN